MCTSQKMKLILVMVIIVAASVAMALWIDNITPATLSYFLILAGLAVLVMIISVMLLLLSGGLKP